MTQQALSHQPDMASIHNALKAWDARARLQASALWLPRGLAAGLTVAVGLAVAARLWPLLPRADLIRLAALSAAGGIALALLAVWLKPRSPLALARRFDQQFGLRERLSTALELAGGVLPVESAVLVAAQRADAARVAGEVDARRGLPLRLRWRDWALVALALGAFATATLIPNPQETALAEQAEVEEAIAEQLEALEALREQALQDPLLSDEQRAAVVETLDAAVETLSQRGVTQQEALAALDAAEQELRDLSERAAAERQEALREASAALERAGAGEIAQALQEGRFAEAGESLSDLAEALQGMSAEEAQSLAGQLDQAADSLENANPELAESLREAAEALRQGDTQSAAEALEQAGEQMAQSGGEGGEPQTGQYADSLQQGQSELAEAGGKSNPRRDQAGQPGQGGMGQAQPMQPGQGDQPQPGSGQPGGDEGSGLDPGQVAGDTPRLSGAEPDGGERPPEIYAPQRIGGEGGEQVDIPGEAGPGTPVTEGELAENPTGESSVPYTEVFGDYSGAVNQALDTGYIPLGMRGLIQQYFSRLEPGE